MAKIGVFTCWCGENIARHIDVERVSKAIESLPGVHCSMNYKYMCSEPGQSLIIDMVEMANIREQCSWVHANKEEATAKAIELIRISVEKLRYNRPLQPITVPITKKALVIGGGVAGIQAALDIAAAGHEVILVEKEPSVGGKMAGLSETFPTLDCSQCILTPGWSR